MLPLLPLPLLQLKAEVRLKAAAPKPPETPQGKGPKKTFAEAPIEIKSEAAGTLYSMGQGGRNWLVRACAHGRLDRVHERMGLRGKIR